MTHPKTRRLTLLILALAATLAGGVALLADQAGAARAPRAGRVAPRWSAAPAPLAADAEAPARPAGLGILPGDALTYRFVLDRLTRCRPVAGQDTGRAGQRVRYEGAFRLTVRGTDGDAWIAGLEMDRFAATRTQPSRRPEPRLDGEVLMRLERSGAIGRLVFPARTSPRACRLWKAILTHWRIVLHADPAASTWETVERDVTGTYRARYEREGAGEIIKDKLEYTELATKGSLGFDVEVTGRARYQLDPLPARIEGSERLAVTLRARGSTIESELSFLYVRVAHERRRLAGARALPAGGTTLAEAEDTTRDVDGEAVRTRARQELAKLAQFAAAGQMRSRAAQAAFSELVSLLQSADTAVDEVRRQILAGAGPLYATLTQCLGLAGTPASQEVLRGLLTEGRWSEAHRQGAVLALVYVKEPIPALDDALVSIHERNTRLSTNALMVLGSLGNRVHGADADRFGRIANFFTSRLTAAGDPRRKAKVLQALGNLGPDRVSEPMRESLEDGHLRIRTAAVRALRRVRDAEADRLLVSAARADASPLVRGAALETLARRTGEGRGDRDVLRDLLARATEDPSQLVRDTAARLAEETRGDRAA